jgi:hypothetical protein
LAGGLARLPARGLGAVVLAPGAARVRSKEGLTVLALPFGKWTSHWPEEIQVNDRKIGVWKEENGEEKSAPKQSEEHGRRREILNLGKKTGWSNRQFHLDRFITVSGYR